MILGGWGVMVQRRNLVGIRDQNFQNTPENESTGVVLDLVLSCPTICKLKGFESFKIEIGNSF